MIKQKIITVIALIALNYNLAYAIPAACPTVDMIKRAQFSKNTHDNFGTWNLFTVGTFGTMDSWTILIGNIKAADLSKANAIAQEALSQLDKVSGPFLAQSHWVCKYTPEPANGYYIIAWNLNPQNISLVSINLLNLPVRQQ